ncbi:MAG: hypothetical protein IJK79_07060 [Bacteroidales bacterium]|nr:hypothetical protein [Bacteroidales bacterium]
MERISLKKTLFPGLFALAIFLFFRLAYPYHVYNQEQFQLFQFTWRYFVETLAVPGGFADWCGRFLTQFFYYSAAGSLILALLIAAIQAATAKLAGNLSPLGYALTFIPPVILLIFFCDADAMPCTLVAVLLSLLCALVVIRIRPSFLRNCIAVVATALLYFLLGPLSVLFIVACSVRERKLLPGLLMAAVFALCVVCLHKAMGYPYYRLLYGINYYRFHHHLPAWPWIAAAAEGLILAVSPMLKRQGKAWEGSAAFAAVMVSGALGIFLSYDDEMETYLKYDFLTRRFQWNAILAEALKDNPQKPFEMASVNLALVKTGNAHRMFDFYQNGPDGLLPPYTNDYIHPLIPSEAYFQLGMINSCQRYTFEAQELIPDFQKSARAYKRLAETNLVNGNHKVAGKYLKTLEKTLFYRGWARTRMALCGNDAAVDADPGYGYLRSVRLHDHDFLFNRQAMETMLGYLVQENPDNHMALEYLLAWNLLDKNLKGFVRFCPFEGYPGGVPRCYQEAFLLDFADTAQSLDNVPAFIDPAVVDSFNLFMREHGGGTPPETLARQFGNTYWFYYFYRLGV